MFVHKSKPHKSFQISPLTFRWRNNKHRRSKSVDDVVDTADATPGENEKATVSGIRQSESTSAISRFSRSKLHLGQLLGEGGFARVYEVVHSPLGGKKGKYAIKCLRSDLASSSDAKQHFQQAADALVREARIMSQLDHPHILALRGLSSADFSQAPLPHSRSTEQFFLVTDRLRQTLTDRMQRWKQQSARAQNTLNFKLQYALQIAKAIRYLHENRIIHRDCTTNNIGFIGKHTVQLFDFGLARKLPGNEHRDEDDDCHTVQTLDTADDEAFEQEECFHMTICGTQRFMAPEVFDGVYNTKADVYSWSMMVVELMTGKKPYSYMTLPVHEVLVLEQGARPRLNPSCFPAGLCPILKSAWEENVSNRWDMQQVCHALEAYLATPSESEKNMKPEGEHTGASHLQVFTGNLQALQSKRQPLPLMASIA